MSSLSCAEVFGPYALAAPESPQSTYHASLLAFQTDMEVCIRVEEMVAPQGRLFELIAPEWLNGRTLGNDEESGLHLCYRHGVLVLRVDDNWGPDPMMPLMGSERLLVGFTGEAMSETVQPPQSNAMQLADWTSVQEWLHKSKSVYSEAIPLSTITHRALEDKKLAEINLQERFGFLPKVIGISHKSNSAMQESVEWFPGGSSIVRLGDELLCHADMLDVQLLANKLDSALDHASRLREKLAQARAGLKQPQPQWGVGPLANPHEKVATTKAKLKPSQPRCGVSALADERARDLRGKLVEARAKLQRSLALTQCLARTLEHDRKQNLREKLVEARTKLKQSQPLCRVGVLAKRQHCASKRSSPGHQHCASKEPNALARGSEHQQCASICPHHAQCASKRPMIASSRSAEHERSSKRPTAAPRSPEHQ